MIKPVQHRDDIVFHHARRKSKAIFLFLIIFFLSLPLITCGDEMGFAVALRGDERINEGYPVPFLLYQNYPNPFNPVTTISFDIGEEMHIRLSVHGKDWQKVATLVDGVMPSGNYRVQFDAAHLANGTYFYIMEGGGVKEILAMHLIR